MPSGRKFSISAGARYTVAVAAEDDDPVHPDRGDESIAITVVDLTRVLADGGFYINVIIREGHGKYSGREAVYRFYFLVE